ncbi:heparanase [Elysia marginata]|uniref:Heparanase n=1 Tax=Elysia marginata TaxID=1093978 RepID=A0AAV4GZ45_9GAST|nr:heparanase [Elysia marginata]
MASALGPTNIRLGGTYADFLHFDPGAVDDALLEEQDLKHQVDTSGFPEFADVKKQHYVTLSGNRWDNITRFCDDVGWDIMWDFNLFLWKDGEWDPTEANRFLKYSAARGVRMPSFQLGNVSKSPGLDRFQEQLKSAWHVQLNRMREQSLNDKPDSSPVVFSLHAGPDSSAVVFSLHAGSDLSAVVFSLHAGPDLSPVVFSLHAGLDSSAVVFSLHAGPDLSPVVFSLHTAICCLT